MKSLSQSRPALAPALAWLTALFAGGAGPVLAMLLLVDTSAQAPLMHSAGPIVAVGLMGSGMIAAAAAGRLWIGLLLALVMGAGLVICARALGMPDITDPFSAALAMVIAAISFAARGALFSRSALGKGWLVAVFVFAGEAAILATAWARPDAIPDWLLALLPAQWASAAIQTAFLAPGTGTAMLTAAAPLIALAGTAAATMLVARLWPRRWPYLVMFTAWLGLSALVFYWPVPPIADADPQTELQRQF